MTTSINELFFEPGDFASLCTSCKIEVSSESPLAGSPLFEPSAPARPVAQIAPGIDIEELSVALRAVAAPSLVIAGLRSARRMEPWPFFVCRQPDSPIAVLAPEEGGFAKLRFPYSDEALIEWLAGGLLRFAAPEIPCPEIPALTTSGLAVMLAIIDIFRGRYPDLDPDWQAVEPVAFTSEEVSVRVAAGKNDADPSSLMNGLARLGGPKPETPSIETVESILYVFSNEGYLKMDLSASTPRFTMTEAFLGMPLSLAWWDMSLSLESRLGGSVEPIRVIQGLALWRFVTGNDQRTSMKAVSGKDIEADIRRLVSHAAIPCSQQDIRRELSSPIPFGSLPEAGARGKETATDFSQTHQFDCPPEPSGKPQFSTPPGHGQRQCPNCKAASSESSARFCSICGKEFPKQQHSTRFCTKCGAQINPEARFCSACGQPV